MTKTIGSVVLAVALVAMTTGSASAEIISLTSTVGGGATGASRVNFDSLALANVGGVASKLITVSFTSGDGETVTGSTTFVHAAPWISGLNGEGFGNDPGADASRYISTGIGSVTLGMPGPQNYFGLLWGSIDDYNTLSFYNDGVLVGRLTGSDVAPDYHDGNQGLWGTRYVNIYFDTPFNRVVAESSQYAFEFDNVALDLTPVPEPASLLLLGTGLVGMVATARRRMRK